MQERAIDGYRLMAVSAIRAIVKDYEYALRHKNNHDIRECEEFFRSKTFAILAPGTDAEYVMQKIKKIVENGEKLKQRNDYFNKTRR